MEEKKEKRKIKEISIEVSEGAEITKELEEELQKITSLFTDKEENKQEENRRIAFRKLEIIGQFYSKAINEYYEKYEKDSAPLNY